MWHNNNKWLLLILLALILFLLASGCSGAYWRADPYVERFKLLNPPQKISVSTEPQGARVVLTSMRRVNFYSGYAPVRILFRPHPHMPSWILVAKPGYKTTAIQIPENRQDTNLHVVLAVLDEDDIVQRDILAGPMMGQPYMPPIGAGRRMGQPF
jgi:hypothetical protein